MVKEIHTPIQTYVTAAPLDNARGPYNVAIILRCMAIRLRASAYGLALNSSRHSLA